MNEVAGGALRYEKRGFYKPDFADVLAFLPLAAVRPYDEAPFFQVKFSPDVRYLVVARGDASIALDVTRWTPIPLSGALRQRIGMSFAFLGSDRIAGIDGRNPQESAIVTFPEGRVIRKLNIGLCFVSAPAHGEQYLVLRGVAGVGAGLFKMADNAPTVGYQASALDVYDDWFVVESTMGELALHRFGDLTPSATASVPAGPLGSLWVAEVSPEADVVALSQRARGGAWISKGSARGTVLPEFTGASLDGPHLAYLDLSGDDGTERRMVRLDAATGKVEPLFRIEDPLARFVSRARGGMVAAVVPGSDARKVSVGMPTVTLLGIRQYGAYLVGFEPGRMLPWLPDDGGKKRVMVVVDARTGKNLWTRQFAKGVPAFAVTAGSWHDTLALCWNYEDAEAKAAIDASAGLKAQIEAMSARKQDVGLIELVDLASGTARGRLLVDFGRDSFRLTSIILAGDSVIVGDDQNRTLAYSLATGRQLGRAFGAPLDVSKNSSMVVVQNSTGVATIYSLPRMEKLDEWAFPASAVAARFHDEDRKLFVVTRDQATYVLSVRKP